jgi:hypothetical protein
MSEMVRSTSERCKVFRPLERTRRVWVGALFALSLLVAATAAHAGSYLDRAGLLLHQATNDGNYLRAHIYDRELARVIHELAETRLRLASKMTVPSEVAQAHPHLLLVLENYERAADAAVNGEVQRFLVYQQRARDETRTFESVLKQLGFKLPERK